MYTAQDEDSSTESADERDHLRKWTLPAANRAADQVPVLMFGAGITGIGVVRNLSRAGIPVYAMCPDSKFVERSRFHRTLPGHGNRVPHPSQLEEFLHSLSIPSAVLMPGSDDWAAAIAALEGPIRARFPASSPPLTVLKSFTDKWSFARLLQREALPHPHTALLCSMEEMRGIPDTQFENRFLKPLGSQEFGLKHKVKAFLIHSKADALVVMAKGEQSGSSDFPILLQEYIPGPPTNHFFVDGFVDRYGEIRALFARRRLRMFPPLLGNSTLMETVPVADVEGALDTIRGMFESLAYRGVFSAEFKFDDRDKLFKILEVNARPWWFVEFAARCGVDVCKMAYQDALHMTVDSPKPYRPGRRCVYLPNDFKAYRFSREGKLFSWLRSWMGADETVFAADDPWPGVKHMSETLVEHFRRQKQS